VTTRQLAFKSIPTLAIAEGDTTPNLGAAPKGAWAWSSTLSKPVYWDGTKWTAGSTGGGGISGIEVVTANEGVLTAEATSIYFDSTRATGTISGAQAVISIPDDRVLFGSDNVPQDYIRSLLFTGSGVSTAKDPSGNMTVSVDGLAKHDRTTLDVDVAAFGHAFVWLPIEAAPNSTISCSLVPNGEWDADDLAGYSVSGVPSDGGIEFCISCDGPIMGFFKATYTIYS
jgi:hypothetical protein